MAVDSPDCFSSRTPWWKAVVTEAICRKSSIGDATAAPGSTMLGIRACVAYPGPRPPTKAASGPLADDAHQFHHPLVVP
jgi:hypothetical protein